MANAAAGALPGKRPGDDLTAQTAERIAKITEQLDALKGTAGNPAKRATDSAQRMGAAAGNLGRGAAAGAGSAASVARTAAAGTAQEARKLGAAARNMGNAPIAAVGAVGRIASRHNAVLFFLVAFLVHLFDVSQGFPRADYGLEILQSVKPAALIGLASLFLAYALFNQIFIKGASVVAIGILIFTAHMFGLIDYMAWIYLWVVIALWVLCFDGLEGGKVNELIGLIAVSAFAYAYPLIGLQQGFVNEGAGRLFLNPLMHPILLYYGLLTFQGISKFARIVMTVLIVAWFILIPVSIYTTNAEIVIGDKTITKQHYVSGAETLNILKDGLVKVLTGIVSLPQTFVNSWIKQNVAEAAGLEKYPGETEGQQEGMRLELLSYTSKKVDISYERGVEIYAVLEPVRRLDEKTSVTSIECSLEQADRGTTSKPIPGNPNPKIATEKPIELVANQQLQIACSFPNKQEGNELKAGNARAKMSATYKFATTAKLRTYFMSAERLQSELSDPSDELDTVARRYDIPTTDIIAKSGNAPVTLGIGGLPEKAPIGISEANERTQLRFIGVSLKNEKATWKGRIAKVNKVELIVPEGIELIEGQGCNFKLTEKNTYEVKGEILARAKDIDDSDFFKCDAKVKNVEAFLNNEPTIDKAFSVKADYDYKTELVTQIEIVQSEKTVAEGSGSTIVYQGKASSPAASCSGLPPERLRNTYESQQAFKSSKTYRQLTDEIAPKYGVDPALIAAFEEEESKFNDYKDNCVELYGTSALTGCDLPTKNCNVNSPHVQTDEAQIECAASWLRGYLEKQCAHYQGDDKWACALCVYQSGKAITDCEWNVKIRDFYCKWKNYYTKETGVLT